VRDPVPPYSSMTSTSAIKSSWNSEFVCSVF
jgi:hypothetical protein